jgi:hypothetical protein
VGREDHDEQGRDRCERGGAHALPSSRTGRDGAGGRFDFTISGETTTLKEGDYYIIPGGVEHGLFANDQPSVALDIFSPPREDYIG